MVRLSKDVQAPSPRPAAQHAADSLARMGVAILRVSEAAHRYGRLVRGRYGPDRSLWARWNRQYPLYHCPYQVPAVWRKDGPCTVPEQCDRTWDRRHLSTEDLRTEVWDHITQHVPGEAGLALASSVVSRIMGEPR